jgi:stage II sporulation protein AA (anti-sigma F factor antagonist)
MALTIEYKNNALLIQVAGDFDLVSAQDFRDAADRALDESSARHMILDLTHLSFMDSSGLGVILGRLRKVQAHQGIMILTGVTPPVRRVLELSGIMPLIKLCATVKQAWSVLGREGKGA